MFGHTYLEGNLLSYFSLCCLVLHDQLVIVQFKARVELIREANKSINLTRGHTILMLNKSSLSSPSLRSPLLWIFFLILLHNHLPPLIILCPLSPPPSLDCQIILQSLFPSHITTDVPDRSFLFWNHLTITPPPTPKYLLLQENIPIIFVLDVALKLFFLNYFVYPVWTAFPHFLISPFLLLLLHHILMYFNEISCSWHPQNIHGFVGE